MKTVATFCTLSLLCSLTYAEDTPLPLPQAKTPSSHSVSFDCREDLLHAFHAAAAKASKPILVSFIKSGICVNERGRSSKTALHYAAAESTWSTIRWLLKQDAEIEAVDDQGNTPLLSAAQKGKHSNVKDLVEEGANIDHRDKLGRSALDLAISANDLRTVKILIKAESRLDAPIEAKKFTPLHRAAKKGVIDIAKALLEAGSDVNAIASDGMSPLHYAAYSENPEMITLLLDANAKATLKGDDGRTPRDIAELYISDHDDCILCSLSALKIRHWEEAILRLRVAELPANSKNDLENHLKLQKDEL